jgi:predicted ABC-type ATPase
MAEPVLTIFAGPNGSGKSTLTRRIFADGHDLGRYINADDIAVEMDIAARDSGRHVEREQIEQDAFWEARRRRQINVDDGVSFAFETVFSHTSTIDLIRLAKARGFIVRLFFVTTENPMLNVARVQKRVVSGGHDVPTEKIIARYLRAMKNLPLACEYVDDATLFDNSSETMRVVAHVRHAVGEPTAFSIVKPVPLWVGAWASEMATLLAANKAT